MTHPPIDPEIAAALAELDGISPSLERADIPGRRALDVIDHSHVARGGRITVTESAAAAVPLVILRATSGIGGAASEPRMTAEPRPGIFFIHGGGLILGGPFGIDGVFLDAAEWGAVLVSPGYRLAPEHQFPSALNDCAAAWRWTVDHAAELGIDRDRLIVAGSSAGAGLAAALTLWLRDEGGRLPGHQVLLRPMLDDRQATPSSQELDGEGTWDRTANRTAWSAYLGDRVGAADLPPYAAPARATDLTGLPPAFIDVGAVDIFRDESLAYAAALSHAGVPVELHLWPGGVHAFAGVAPGAAVSVRAVAAERDYVRRALGFET